MIRNIHHLGIRVRDFDGMVEFYREAFGFEVVGHENRYDDGEGHTAARMVMMRAGNCFVEIFHQAAASGSAESLTADAGYAHLSVEVTGIETEYERLKGLGVTFAQPAPVDFGHVKSVNGRDPEGNIIELLQTIHTWECEFDKLPAISR